MQTLLWTHSSAAAAAAAGRMIKPPPWKQALKLVFAEGSIQTALNHTATLKFHLGAALVD